jgi:pimeloyl-ACP methyl ester carboxylesterase
MLAAEIVRAEGPRYAARLVLVPGLWSGPAVWRGFAGALGHRGWDCHLLDVRPVAGGLAARAAAVAGYVATLDAPAVLIGHDAGALVVASTAAHGAAAVLLAPLAPGTRPVRALVRSLAAVVALVRGRPVPPPSGEGFALLAGELTGQARTRFMEGLGPDDARVVREVAWGRAALRPPGRALLVVRGANDPLLPGEAATALARALGAEVVSVDGTGHWPHVGPAWQRTVDLVHRWVVQTLGAPLLALYEEAMAERAEEEGDGD